MSNFLNSQYNPDILSTLANLSNDEVFTPPNVVNQMLDLLPKSLWTNKDMRFLDPTVKSGVFLREIAVRLIEGLENEFPVLEERLNHIFKNQLFGISITEITSLLSRRSLYCSKFPNSRYSVVSFENISGNIRFINTKHSWKNEKCIYCGASRSEYEREEKLESHAYEFIHRTNPEEIFNMKFDVIIGNPPYQLSTGGNRAQATPLYDKFVEQAIKLNPRYISMIIPARWYSGGMGLDEFRNKMIHDHRISKLVDYHNSKDCFDGVDIAGGVCFFLWERDRKSEDNLCEITNFLGQEKTIKTRKLDAFGDIFIRNNNSISIIEKVQKKSNSNLSDFVFSLDPFGFPTQERGREVKKDGDIELVHSQGIGYIERYQVKKNANLVDSWKVTIARVVPGNGEVGVDPAKGYKATTTPRLLSPGQVNSFTYMLLGAFKNKYEAENFQKYMCTKLARFMLRLTFSSMNIAKSNFIFVPKMDFNGSVNIFV